MNRLTLRSLPFAATFIVPLLAALAVWQQGLWLWGPPLFLFVLTPVMDAFLGVDKAEQEPEAAAERWRDLRYDVWLWLWIPVQLAVLAAAIVAATRPGIEGTTMLGLVFASGLTGGLGINVGHELMHRKGRPERAAAEVLMTSVAYAHFCVEHVLGHHKNVATPLDPASARKGETVYGFVPRSVLLGLRSAWRLEGARIHKLGIPALSLRNRRLRYPLVFAVIVLAIGSLAGPAGVLVFVGQGAVAIALLEVINYVEHYGLSRAQIAEGVYERVVPAHSWNSGHRLTNWYLFHLPRHADHHAAASRPYFALRHIEDSPQLPAGYATMLLAALVPPLWRAIMDPLLLQHAAPRPDPVRAGGVVQRAATHGGGAVFEPQR